MDRLQGRLSKRSGCEKAFEELGTRHQRFHERSLLIARLQHRNLVELLGCCIEGQERILVYEYMPNNSLDHFTFDRGGSHLLIAETRFEIILGVARGLLYLHQDSKLRVIRRDIKTSNILLDSDMNPKISDFGVARIIKGSVKEARTRKIVGTYGYMSPTYAFDGKFSVKSDVYSFGVLVLEVVSGQRHSCCRLTADLWDSWTNSGWSFWQLKRKEVYMLGCCACRSSKETGRRGVGGFHVGERGGAAAGAEAIRFLPGKDSQGGRKYFAFGRHTYHDHTARSITIND